MDSYWVDTWLSGASLDAGLSPGEITLVSSGAGIVQIGSAAIGSGETSVTYQWYVSTFVPYDGNYGAVIPGATSATYTASSSIDSGDTYYYTRLVTDSYGRTGWDYIAVDIPFDRYFKLEDFSMLSRERYWFEK